LNVTSIVLSWNRRDDTLACLDALVAQATPGATHRVLLVDNGSTDDSVGGVRAAFPAVEIAALPSNVGYAAGANHGIRTALASGADWTLLVNNDTVAEPGLVAGLLSATGQPRVGMATPTIVHLDAPDRVWPSAGWRRRWTLAPFDTTVLARGDAPRAVQWATGCCLLVARDLWLDVGLFDERYRFYYEDHDLCLRAVARGWRILHVPAARIRHRVAGSTGEGTPAQMYLLARGSVPFFLAHTRGAHRVFIVVYRLASLVRTVGEALGAGRPSVAAAYLRGLRDGWRDARSARADRTDAGGGDRDGASSRGV
jgi:GT2 family glycosyltransferase